MTLLSNIGLHCKDAVVLPFASTQGMGCTTQFFCLECKYSSTLVSINLESATPDSCQLAVGESELQPMNEIGMDFRLNLVAQIVKSKVSKF